MQNIKTVTWSKELEGELTIRLTFDTEEPTDAEADGLCEYLLQHPTLKQSYTLDEVKHEKRD